MSNNRTFNSCKGDRRWVRMGLFGRMRVILAEFKDKRNKKKRYEGEV